MNRVGAAVKRIRTGIFPWIVVALLGVVGCGGDSDAPSAFDPSRPPVVSLSGPTPERLSEYNLLAYDGEGQFRYNSRIIGYDLNTPLFSDYALKDRAMFVPEGTSVAYTDSVAFDFPVGSVIIKSFSVAADLRTPDDNRTLVETRLLIRFEDGWRAFPYVWNEAQTDAFYTPGGEVRAVPFIDADGEDRVANYLIPQRNQCRSCHERVDANGETRIVLIGPKARNLNRSFDYGEGVGEVNQLTRMADLGMLTGLPNLADVDAAYDFASIEENGVAGLTGSDLNEAARSYLDINCAHCHNPNGVQGVTSQLFLDYANADQFRLGVCKPPLSAGTGAGMRSYDIVPGNPDESVMVFRVETEQPGAMMPLLGRSLQHRQGAELLRAWVAEMPPNDCGAP